MPSKQALERRKKFLAAKEEHGGYLGIREWKFARPVIIYFDDEGTIVGLTQDPIKNRPDWNSYEFTQEQVQILKGQNTNFFKITQDPKEETLYHITPGPLEDEFILSENYTVTLIPLETRTTEVYDITITINANKFRVNMHNNVRSSYTGIDPYIATANGQKLLRFYITSQGDPHFLLTNVNIRLSTLLENKVVEITLNEDDYTKCDVYTMKLFSTYIRTGENNERV